MITVSSLWNFGMKTSPLRTSLWLRGRNRHITLMLHGLNCSVMVQGETGGERGERERGESERGGRDTREGAERKGEGGGRDEGERGGERASERES